MWIVISILLKFLLVFLLIFGLLRLLRFVSVRYELLDMPNYISNGRSQSPILSAVILYLTASLTALMLLEPERELYLYLLGSAFVIILGALDEYYKLQLNKRFLVQIIAAVLMVFGAKIRLDNLGNIFIFTEITLPTVVSTPVTLLLVGVFVNAMYRIDGIEGMVTGLSIEAMLTLLILTGVHASILWLVIALVCMLTVFLIEELKLKRQIKHLVTGQAVSMFLGFSIVWGVLSYSQITTSGEPLFEPITGLYVLGLPLIDMIINTIRLYKKGLNPFTGAFRIFKPTIVRQTNFSALSAHTHMHHILIHAGFNRRSALFSCLIIGGLINMLGIILHLTKAPESTQLALWLLVVYFYYRAIKNAFRISHWLHRFKSHPI